MIHDELTSSFHILLQNFLNGVDRKEEQEPIALIASNGNKELVSLEKANVNSNINDYVAVIPYKSPVFKYSQNCGPTGTKDYAKIIDMYYNDPKCICVVIDTDSGGGQVSGTAEFYDFIFARRDKIEIYSDGLLASAAYYWASASKKITVNKRAEKIGSIGCMVHGLDFSEKLAKEGIKEIILYGTKSTAKNDTTRKLKDGDTQYYITKEIDPTVDEFHADIVNARPNINKEVFDGRAVAPAEALEYGLVDAVDNLENVVNRIYADHKQSNNSNNSNSNMKMSNHAKVMAAIGVATLAITDDKGSYFNEEQLQSMEDALAAKETENATLATNLQTATESLTTAQTEAQTAKDAQANSLQTIASALGLGESATVEGITERIATLKPQGHTAPTGTEKPTDEATSIIDANASHNQLANQIFNR